jgi:hypothetical protein
VCLAHADRAPARIADPGGPRREHDGRGPANALMSLRRRWGHATAEGCEDPDREAEASYVGVPQCRQLGPARTGRRAGLVDSPQSGQTKVRITGETVMSVLRRAVLAGLVSALAPAFAQTPPPAPASEKPAANWRRQHQAATDADSVGVSDRPTARSVTGPCSPSSMPPGTG